MHCLLPWQRSHRDAHLGQCTCLIALVYPLSRFPRCSRRGSNGDSLCVLQVSGSLPMQGHPCETSHGWPVANEGSSGMTAHCTVPRVAQRVLMGSRASYPSTASTHALQPVAQAVPEAAAGRHALPGSLVPTAQQPLTQKPKAARDENTAASVQPCGRGCSTPPTTHSLTHYPKAAETVPPTALGSVAFRFAKKARQC